MKMFFMFLLVINLLISVWIYTQPTKNNLMVKPMPENLASLMLLKEAGTGVTAEQSSVVMEEAAKEKADVDTELEKMCFTLGPFEDEGLLGETKKQLNEKGLDIEVRKREESERHRYWVYLPETGSRTQAIEVSKQLAKAGVADYYIVHSGAKKNAISLGHFKEKLHADYRISELKTKGFSAEMEVIFRYFNVFWLDYSVVGNKDMRVDEYIVDGVARLSRGCN